MERIGRYAAAALLALPAALGTGCEDEPDPNIPSASATPTESSSSPSPSPTPEPETAEEFIERWNLASTEMQNTGDPSGYAALVAPGCEPCDGLIGTVTDYYAAGGYVKATPWSITSVIERPGGTRLETIVEVSYVAEPTEFSRSADDPIEHTQGGRNTLAVTLRKKPESWVVHDYLVVPS